MKAVIEQGRDQFLVEKNDVILVDNIALEPGSSFEIDKVLLIKDGEEIKVGTPFVEKAVVKAEVLGNEKTKKVISFKMKAKKNYHRTVGSRQIKTKIEIKDIIS